MSYFSGNTDRPGHEDYTIGLNRPYGPRVQAVNVEKKDQRVRSICILFGKREI